MILYDSVWLFMNIFDYACHFTTLYDFVWLGMTLHDTVLRFISVKLYMTPYVLSDEVFTKKLFLFLLLCARTPTSTA